MLRSILVALDATAASAAAQRLALRLAQRFASRITGITVLDRAYLTAPSAVGIGGVAYKKHRDQVKRRKPFLLASRKPSSRAAMRLASPCR